MAKAQILIQLDPDEHASVFDAVVAIDAGVERLLQYDRVKAEKVRELVHGAIFTRGPQDLANTAIFIGGADAAKGEELLKQVKAAFFGPMRVSVLLDTNGANTTAAGAVLAAAKHVDLGSATALVLGGTGPVGQRAARLLAGEGATVRVASRTLPKAEETCRAIQERIPNAKLEPRQCGSEAEIGEALAGTSIVIAAGAAGVELLSAPMLQSAATVRVAIDLNAVPPVGIAGIGSGAKGEVREQVICYGALGVGGTKMKIHRAALQKLFTANNLVLDAEEIFQIGKEL
jgi:methylenetetrahydrofolate/methylenetetrahydromethanopterin dehydrogenase (NADP+)